MGALVAQLRSLVSRCRSRLAFLDKARSFRNALRPYGYQPVPLLAPKDISALARSAHAASPLAFLVVESRRTRDALGELVRAISHIQGVLAHVALGHRPGRRDHRLCDRQHAEWNAEEQREVPGEAVRAVVSG